jgi:hypothetical protein
VEGVLYLRYTEKFLEAYTNLENLTLRIKQVTEQNSITEKILAELSKELLNGDQLSEIFNNPIEFPTLLIEKLSLTTAIKYWKGHIDYSEADCIMNNLFIFWGTNEYYFKNYGFSEIGWDCYNAFDAGEFYRENDNKSIDPSEKYTRPLVESLLRKLKQIV